MNSNTTSKNRKSQSGKSHPHSKPLKATIKNIHKSKNITATSLKQHLYKVLPSVGIELTMAKAAYEYIKEKHEYKETGIIYRQRNTEICIKKSSQLQQLVLSLHLLEPEDENECELMQQREKHKKELENVIDDNSNTSVEMGESNNIIPTVGKSHNYNVEITLLKTLVGKRLSKRQGAVDDQLQSLTRMKPAVQEWLLQQPEQKLLLIDGELGVQEKIHKRKMSKETCMQALCEYFLSVGCDQALQLTRTVMMNA